MENNINHVTWSDSYSMGLTIVDDQHKELFRIVNDLYNHSTGNETEERAYFTKVIQQAVWYIKEHFATEEKMMIATKFPGYLEHKKAHDEFTMTVVKSVKGYESGEQLVLEKFAYFLKNWVLTHIPIMDKQYAVYFEKVPITKLIQN